MIRVAKRFGRSTMVTVTESPAPLSLLNHTLIENVAWPPGCTEEPPDASATVMHRRAGLGVGEGDGEGDVVGVEVEVAVGDADGVADGLLVAEVATVGTGVADDIGVAVGEALATWGRDDGCGFEDARIIGLTSGVGTVDGWLPEAGALDVVGSGGVCALPDWIVPGSVLGQRFADLVSWLHWGRLPGITTADVVECAVQESRAGGGVGTAPAMSMLATPEEKTDTPARAPKAWCRAGRTLMNAPS